MNNIAKRITLPIFVVFALLRASSAFATSHIYGFTSGIDPSIWEVMFDTDLYTVDDSEGTVHISKPVGGDYTLQMLHVRFRPIVSGDFDVSVQFRAAYIDRVDGRPGNQIQLNATFGGQTVSVVRSDEVFAGHNYHLWEDPPEVWQGEQADTTSSGLLRLTRVGTTVTAYYRKQVIYSADYNAEDVTFLSFSLQNNGTTDSTSVTFDNFFVSADSIEMNSPTGIDGRVSPLATMRIAPNPLAGGTRIDYSLETAGQVYLSVYDVTGRLIKRLDEGRRYEGAHVARWDGRGLAGELVPSGVYFAALEFEGRVITRKMTVVR